MNLTELIKKWEGELKKLNNNPYAFVQSAAMDCRKQVEEFVEDLKQLEL